MDAIEKIRTVIVENDKESLFLLQEHLSFFREIDLLGGTDQYDKAKRLLIGKKPDLAFLDIEMPCKNGFELLREVRENGCDNLNVIFCSSYNKYMMQALHESAFDYILKPIGQDELKVAIQRYKDYKDVWQEKQAPIQPSLFPELPGIPGMVALPTGTGMRFIDKNTIVLFRCLKESPREKPVWIASLNDFSQIRLRAGITAKEIIRIVGSQRYITVTQSVVVNLSYLAGIEFKTRNCFLIPPYNKTDLPISRNQLSKLREKFDLL